MAAFFFNTFHIDAHIYELTLTLNLDLEPKYKTRQEEATLHMGTLSHALVSESQCYTSVHVTNLTWQV